MKITLNVVDGPNRGQSYSLDKHSTFIVGRGWTAHLRLPPKDKFFSRNHFMIEANPPLCRLIDMASLNGTFVNERRVTDVELNNGDVIRGGDTQIRVSIDWEPWIDSTNGAGDVDSDPSATVVESLPSSQPQDIGGTVRETTYVGEAVTEPEGSLRKLGRYRLIRELGQGGMGGSVPRVVARRYTALCGEDDSRKRAGHQTRHSTFSAGGLDSQTVAPSEYCRLS